MSTEPPAPSRRSASVEASLRYTIDTGIKPVNATVGPGGRLRQRTGGRDDLRVVAIHDARAEAPSLEREGFVLVEHPTAVTDFWDEAQREAIYDPEIEALVRAVSGAAKVLVFDHTLRSADPRRQDQDYAREPVKIVHNDYTDWSGPQRVRDLLPPEQAEARLRRRVAVIQVWRAIGAPIEAEPLALCDARTLAPADLIPAERRHPNRVGEIYQVAYSPAHRWSYFPRMTRDEAVVFKVYDSERDGRARFVPHTSFDLPPTPGGAAPRESLEVRTLAFF